MSRRLAGALGVLAVALLGLGVWFLSSRSDAGPTSSEARASTPAGSLSFAMAEGWRTLECPSDEGDCLRVATPGMPDGQAATVSFVPPNPVEGTPIDVLINPDITLPGATRITVDGLPATRLDPDSSDGQDTIVVAGRARTEVGHVFMVTCPIGDDADRSRGLCDQIVRTLKVTR